MTQNEMILQHLQQNPEGITQREAMKLYGVSRLSAIINFLKFHWGYKKNIKSETIKVKNRFGNDVYVSRYFWEEA